MARKIAKDSNDTELHTMSFGEHIEELRRRLIYGLAGLLVVFAVMLYYARSIVGWLFEPLATAQNMLGMPAQTYTRSSLGGLAVYMKVALIGAIIISAPWLLYQAWKFISAGLYATEKKAATFLVALSALMSAAGLMLTYYVFLPAAVVFLLQFTVTYPVPKSNPGGWIYNWERTIARWNKESILSNSPTIGVPKGPATEPAVRVIVPEFPEGDPPHPMEGEIWHNWILNETREMRNGNIIVYVTSPESMMGPMIDPSEYMGEAVMLALGIVVVFHVPVVMCVLGMTGLVNPTMLSKRRLIVLFCCFLGAFLFVPGQDIFSNFAIPLIAYFLFELGLILMGIFYRRALRRRAAEDAKYAAEEAEEAAS